MLRQLTGLLAGMLVVMVLAACGGQNTIIDRRTSDGITFTLEHPAQPVAMRDYPFVVTLTDAENRPIDASSVYFDFTMPQMVMGTNQPIADRLGPGRYGIRTLYSMEGDWRVTVVALIDGRETRAIFDLPVLPP